jgi:hypothetical protein
MQNLCCKKDTKDTGAAKFGLRGDLGSNRGVRTVIESGSDKDLELGGSDTDVYGRDRGKWNTSMSRLTEMSSDEEVKDGKQPGLKTGIRKTTVSTQTTQFNQ